MLLILDILRRGFHVLASKGLVEKANMTIAVHRTMGVEGVDVANSCRSR